MHTLATPPQRRAGGLLPGDRRRFFRSEQGRQPPLVQHGRLRQSSDEAPPSRQPETHPRAGLVDRRP